MRYLFVFFVLIFLGSCEKPSNIEKSEPLIKLAKSSFTDDGKSNGSFDYTSCIEKAMLLDSVFGAEMLSKHYWLSDENLKDLANFYGRVDEYEFFEEQVDVESRKLIQSGKVTFLLKAYATKTLAVYLNRDLDDSTADQVAYAVDAYNSGSLSKSAVFQVRVDDELSYDFFITAKYIRQLSEWSKVGEAKLELSENKNHATFSKETVASTFLLDYYLVAVKNPLPCGTEREDVNYFFNKVLILENVKTTVYESRDAFTSSNL